MRLWCHTYDRNVDLYFTCHQRPRCMSAERSFRNWSDWLSLTVCDCSSSVTLCALMILLFHSQNWIKFTINQTSTIIYSIWCLHKSAVARSYSLNHDYPRQWSHLWNIHFQSWHFLPLNGILAEGQRCLHLWFLLFNCFRQSGRGGDSGVVFRKTVKNIQILLLI